MNCPQYDFAMVNEHATGNVWLRYLRLFDDLSLFVLNGDDFPQVTPSAFRYNGIAFKDIDSRIQYYNIVKIIEGQRKLHLGVLTRDPILQMVSVCNIWIFNLSMSFLGLLPWVGLRRAQHKILLKSSNHYDFVKHLLLLNDFYFRRCLLDYRILPFFKNKTKEVCLIDTHDVLPENVYSTMDYFKHHFFNSEIDYIRVEVSISANSIYTGWMFNLVPAFQYSSHDLNFSLRPLPLQLNWLLKIPETTSISYEQVEVEWTCGNFDGKVAFNLVPDKMRTPQMLLDIMPRIKKVCEADDKRLLRKYCRKTSFMVNLTYKLYDTLKTSKEEIVEILKTDRELLEKFKSKIYAKAAALHELGYDVTKHWAATAELFEGGNLLPEEHKNDHLYAVIDELKENLLRQGDEIERITKEKAELESRLKNQEMETAHFAQAKSERDKKTAALKQKHQLSSLSKKQKLLYRLITPIVRKFTSEAQFKRFRETPALFFKSLKKRKYRIFGELFFPARRGLF